MQYTATCVDEGWKYSLVMQLVQMRLNKDGNQKLQYIICFATCADEFDSCTAYLLLQLGRFRGGTQDAVFMCYKSALPWHPKFTGQLGVGKGGFYSPGRWDFAIVQDEGNLHNIQVIVIIIEHLSMKQLILQ